MAPFVVPIIKKSICHKLLLSTLPNLRVMVSFKTLHCLQVYGSYSSYMLLQRPGQLTHCRRCAVQDIDGTWTTGYPAQWTGFASPCWIEIFRMCALGTWGTWLEARCWPWTSWTVRCNQEHSDICTIEWYFIDWQVQVWSLFEFGMATHTSTIKIINIDIRPLFTKRKDVFPQDLMKSRRRKIKV